MLVFRAVGRRALSVLQESIILGYVMHFLPFPPILMFLEIRIHV